MIQFMLSVVVVAYALLAIAIWTGRTRVVSKGLFSLICSQFMLWALSILVFVTTTNPAVALASSKIYYIASSCFAVALAFFAYHYPRNTKLPTLGVLVSLGAWLVLAGMIVLVDDFMVREFVPTASGGWHGIINPTGYGIFSIFFVLFFVIAIAIAFYKYFSYRGAERLRASVYAFGVLLNSIPGFIANLALPAFGIYEYVWVGPVASVVVVMMIAYSVYKHRLLDIKAFFVNLFVYVLSLALIILAYATLMITLITPLVQDENSTVKLVINIAVTIVVALTFQPLRRFFDTLTNNLLYIRQYDDQELVNRISKVCVEDTDLSVLTAGVNEILDDTLCPRFLAFVFDDETHSVTSYGKVPKRYVDRIALARHATRQQDDAYRLREVIVVRLETSSRALGYMVLGSPIDGRPFGNRDRRTIKLVAEELSIAIQNIFRLEEIRSLANNLESEVDDATRELRRTNNKLVELDATKDEFVSMASHQLRTPLTSIKGYISMILDGDAGEINKDQRRLLTEAFESSERMVRLIGDFLNVSRIQTGKFLIERTLTDMDNVVTTELSVLNPVAKGRSITIEYKKHGAMPLLYLDENKFGQVVMNFIDNAIFYSHEGSKIRVSLDIEDGSVVFRVKDQGIGVPKAQKKGLFHKFFRADNARKQRPDGTGVGLFLAKMVVDAHSGKLVFESEEGMGSTFGFRLPIRKLSRPPAEEPTLPTQTNTAP